MKTTSCSLAFIPQSLEMHTHINLVNRLLATGKCILSIPPDCFVWTGTKEELEQVMREPVEWGGKAT